jgi:hypothetical protein
MNRGFIHVRPLLGGFDAWDRSGDYRWTLFPPPGLHCETSPGILALMGILL